MRSVGRNEQLTVSLILHISSPFLFNQSVLEIHIQLTSLFFFDKRNGFGANGRKTLQYLQSYIMCLEQGRYLIWSISNLLKVFSPGAFAWPTDEVRRASSVWVVRPSARPSVRPSIWPSDRP